MDERDDLENQVLGLARHRDALQMEIASYASLQETIQELKSEVRKEPFISVCLFSIS
jgi:hypothetical protein